MKIKTKKRKYNKNKNKEKLELVENDKYKVFTFTWSAAPYCNPQYWTTSNEWWYINANSVATCDLGTGIPLLMGFFRLKPENFTPPLLIEMSQTQPVNPLTNFTITTINYPRQGTAISQRIGNKIKMKKLHIRLVNEPNLGLRSWQQNAEFFKQSPFGDITYNNQVYAINQPNYVGNQDSLKIRMCLIYDRQPNTANRISNVVPQERSPINIYDIFSDIDNQGIAYSNRNLESLYTIGINPSNAKRFELIWEKKMLLPPSNYAYASGSIFNTNLKYPYNYSNIVPTTQVDHSSNLQQIDECIDLGDRMTMYSPEIPNDPQLVFVHNYITTGALYFITITNGGGQGTFNLNPWTPEGQSGNPVNQTQWNGYPTLACLTGTARLFYEDI